MKLFLLYNVQSFIIIKIKPIPFHVDLLVFCKKYNISRKKVNWHKIGVGIHTLMKRLLFIFIVFFSTSADWVRMPVV
ncbi:MAG TPA: hypothetical protein PKO16_02185, partial [Bacteroidia bacterium]|nr:hypothetical protein [Bacteroidia bacterium]